MFFSLGTPPLMRTRGRATTPRRLQIQLKRLTTEKRLVNVLNRPKMHYLKVRQALGTCQVQSLSSVPSAYVDLWDLLNNFCCHVYAQK